MRNYYNESLIQILELYAEEMGYIDSEEMLSERFDSDELPAIIEAYGVKGEEFTDTDMINQAFNNWTDELCKEGEIHPEQYNSYDYVGKYAE